VTAAVLLLTATGCLTVGLRAHQVALADPSPPTSVQAVSPQAVSPQAFSPVAAQPVGAQPVGEPVAPVSLRIPAIGVATTLGELGLNPDRTVQVPTDFTQPGWFGLGPVPGQLGSAVILGHVDSYQGPAVFFRLGSLHTGDQVDVALTNKTVAHFGVTTVTTYPKEQFPAQLVYAPHGGSTLNLVTCGGEFDTHTRSYRSNVVVTTTLTALTTSPS
jgi:sortase (surface protein transpeptidase)